MNPDTTAAPQPKETVIPPVYGNRGWICTICGASNSPFVAQCPCCIDRYMPHHWPGYPQAPWVPGDVIYKAP